MARNMLKLYLKFGGGLISSVCVCLMLFVMILTVNDTTRLARLAAEVHNLPCCKRNDIRRSYILSKNNSGFNHVNAEQTRSNQTLSTKNTSKSFNETHARKDKYLDWIPYPQQNLVPLSDNPYVISNSDICRKINHVDIIVLIHSATENFKRRQGIRSTWGNFTALKHTNLKIVFILGLTEKNKIQMAIERENDKYRDIIQGRFIDTYQNLTHKAVLGLRWVRDFCSGDSRVLKVDDDVFINTFKLFSSFHKTFDNKENIIYCKRQDANTSVIQRNEDSKWKVNEKELENFNYFPLNYCHGFFISMTTKMASELYEAARDMPFFWIDDFFVYGLLTDKIGVNRNLYNMHDLLSLHTYNSLDCFGSETTRCNLLVGNAPSLEFMQLMWKKMLNQNDVVPAV